MHKKLIKGERFPPLQAETIHGSKLVIPDSSVRFVHLQFRRFAGCPICNLHLQSFVARINEITAARIREVVIFHSSKEELLPFQGKFPFDVIGDPKKILYDLYGVNTSIFAILSPGAWPAMIKGNLAKKKPAMSGFPKGGPLGLPADFLVDSGGTICGVKYGKHADDNWSVDELISLSRKVGS